MSEEEFMIKQLEHFINNGFIEAAQLMLREICVLKLQVRIAFPPEYLCACHKHFMSIAFESSNIKDFLYFDECKHYVCNQCIDHYLISTFNRFGMDIEYVCPGCNAQCSSKKTPLNYRSDYFLKSISSEAQEAAIEKMNEQYKEIIQIRQQKPKTVKCYFLDTPIFDIKCNGREKVRRLMCGHWVCQECMQLYLYMFRNSSQFQCFVPTCAKFLSHEVIKSFLVNGSELFKTKIPTISIEGINYYTCPNEKCKTRNLLSKEDDFYKCICGYEVCCKCGNIRHLNIPCFIAIQGLDKYSEIECSEHNPDSEYRLHYFNALILFEWDLHSIKKLELQKKFSIKLKVKRVVYIYNPILHKAYEKSKQQMIENNIEPGEQTVFHATKRAYYPLICKNGFLIGGIDTPKTIGHTYGLGIYTSTDATMCIHFCFNYRILLCKGLTGRLTEEPIIDPHEFLNTQYNSGFVDFFGEQSNYYIFFQRKNLLPYYLIDYE